MDVKKGLAALLAAGLMITAGCGAKEEQAEPMEQTAQLESAVQAEPTEVPESPAEESVENEYAQELDASYTLALNAISAEDYVAAREYLSMCFAFCDPQSDPVMYADLLLKQACIDVIEGKYDMAVLGLDAALRVQPDLADAYLVRTQVYSIQGDIDLAIESLEKYIELSEDTALYETVAQLHEANGDIEAAQAAYDKYVAGAGSEVEEAGFQSGLYKMESGQLEEAIAAFEAYADSEVYGAGAMYNIGICKMNLEDYAGAVEAFTACEEKGGEFEGLYYNRGVCALMIENWNTAAADFTKSIETEPFAADARFNLGVCQMQMEDYAGAIEAFTEVIEDGETGADSAYYYRAACRAASGDLDGAIEDYTVCIDHGYELAQSYYERAQVYAALGDTENQNRDLENSLRVTG